MTSCGTYKLQLSRPSGALCRSVDSRLARAKLPHWVVVALRAFGREQGLVALDLAVELLERAKAGQPSPYSESSR